MSIFSSLYIGMSGMRTHESAIGVIGNNIANLNTIGYKSSRAVFADMLSHTVLGTAGQSQTGQGAALAAVQRMVGQGALLGTNVTTDLAINGEGYFMATDPAGGRYYTRNGQLQLDNDGYLTTIDNLKLQGYAASPDGTFATALSDLRVGETTSPPRATTGVAVVANLDREADLQTFDVTQAAATSSHSTTVTVYDSLGAGHQLEVYFSQNASGQWEWNAVGTQNDLDGSGDTTPVVLASGNLEFDADGKLVTETQTLQNIAFANATPQDVLFDFGEELSTGGDGSGSTSFASPSAVSYIDQDGFATGTLSFVEIGTDGTISGTFTNGQERPLAKLALAKFGAPQALNAIGGNLFTETQASGQPAIGEAGTGGRGDILSGSLEQSNVDLTNEFTSLILAQRGFQASSRTITTADEMLVETVNLKR
ncbi:MAG: flagellar hook protein FlgE [Deltaproteobacteria bacterium]|nr:flagellar hook protein FlgE [Deltaproteobacteria bacterium]